MESHLFNPVESQEPIERELFRHVNEHKYFVNQSLSRELTMEEAFESWSTNVYGPLSLSMDEEGLYAEFPDMNEDELFFKVNEHWHQMKDGGKIEVAPQQAVLDYGARFAPSPASRESFQLKLSFR